MPGRTGELIEEALNLKDPVVRVLETVNAMQNEVNVAGAEFHACQCGLTCEQLQILPQRRHKDLLPRCPTTASTASCHPRRTC